MARRQRTQRVPVALPSMETAPESWLRNIRMSGFTFMMLGLVILAVIVLAPSLRLVIEQQQQLAELRAAVDDKETSVSDLEDDVARWSDPAYIKAEARDRLYYVMPGETSFLVIDDATPAAPDATGGVSDTISATDVDWLSSLFASGMTAGLSTETPDELQSNGTVQEVPAP